MGPRVHSFVPVVECWICSTKGILLLKDFSACCPTTAATAVAKQLLLMRVETRHEVGALDNPLILLPLVELFLTHQVRCLTHELEVRKAR